MVGEAYVTLAKYEKALEHQKWFLKLAKDANDKVEQQRAWASIGRAQMLFAESKGEEGEEKIREEALAASKNAFHKSLAIATTELNDLRKRDLMEMKARLMLNLGLVHDLQGQPEEALKKIEKAAELCQANELYEDHCRCLESLGPLKHRQGDSAAALDCLGRALKIAKRMPAEERSALTCDILVAQSEVFLTMGDFSAAKHALQKAYNLGPKDEGVKVAIEKNLKIAVAVLRIEKQLQEVNEDEYYGRKKLFENIADCACEVKAYTTAINYYKKMLECSEILGDAGKDLSAPLFSLGQTYKDNKQYTEAIEYFERDNEVWVNNPEEACKSLQELASVYKLQGNEDEQLNTLERARVQALLAGSKTLQLAVLREIASHHRSRGNSAAADEVDDEILELRRMGDDSEGMSSQDICSSQEQGATNAWESVDISDLSPDNSESDSEMQQVQPTRLRQRNQFRITKNEKGETALHTACIHGKIDQVQKLLDARHPVNSRDNAGWTPLHEAANHGFKDIVEILLEHGANISDRGGVECDGLTPLHDAASNGCMDVMELLLDKGADVTARTYKKPDS
ncbi:hypothetical protein B566_EDAN000932 [Ephemera danica]|nr:hypothetical protein B566_EDAN000932 [Ephemera danica]